MHDDRIVYDRNYAMLVDNPTVPLSLTNMTHIQQCKLTFKKSQH